MIKTHVILWLMFAHWVGDFLLQSDRMARNKSKSNSVLLTHVGVWTVVMTSAVGWLHAKADPAWAANVLCWFAITHFWIDWVTSRITSRLYAANETHWFFVVVGFDQYLHFLTIVFVANYI